MIDINGDIADAIDDDYVRAGYAGLTANSPTLALSRDANGQVYAMQARKARCAALMPLN